MKEENPLELTEVQEILLNINFDPREAFYKFFEAGTYFEQDYYPFVDVFPYPNELKKELSLHNNL